MNSDLRTRIERAASALGVSDAALKKWWQRSGVPPKWRMPIINRLVSEGCSVGWDDLTATGAGREGQTVPASSASQASECA